MPAKISGKLKDTILVVSVILMIGCCAMALSSNQTAGRVQQDLEQERYQRIVAEENLFQATTKLTTVEFDLSAAKSKIESIQVILKEGKDQSTDLKDQLENLARTKEELEKKIEGLKSEQASMISKMQAAAAENVPSLPVAPTENSTESAQIPTPEVTPQPTP